MPSTLYIVMYLLGLLHALDFTSKCGDDYSMRLGSDLSNH